jgi:hypothetical protein
MSYCGGKGSGSIMKMFRRGLMFCGKRRVIIDE